jgi:hypothetical protein
LKSIAKPLLYSLFYQRAFLLQTLLWTLQKEGENQGNKHMEKLNLLWLIKASLLLGDFFRQNHLKRLNSIYTNFSGEIFWIIPILWFECEKRNHKIYRYIYCRISRYSSLIWIHFSEKKFSQWPKRTNGFAFLNTRYNFVANIVLKERNLKQPMILKQSITLKNISNFPTEVHPYLLESFPKSVF